MKIITREQAIELFHNSDKEVYKIYQDDSESLIERESEFNKKPFVYGIEEEINSILPEPKKKPKEKKLYSIVWQIEINATDPLFAVKEALEIQRDNKSGALFFQVHHEGKHILDIDLYEGTQTPVQFTNTFENWHETHFEIVQEITDLLDNENSDIVNKVQNDNGRGGLYLLALDLTNKFEKMHEGKQWGIDDNTQYYDAIEEFIEKELY